MRLVRAANPAGARAVLAMLFGEDLGRHVVAHTVGLDPRAIAGEQRAHMRCIQEPMPRDRGDDLEIPSAELDPASSRVLGAKVRLAAKASPALRYPTTLLYFHCTDYYNTCLAMIVLTSARKSAIVSRRVRSWDMTRRDVGWQTAEGSDPKQNKTSTDVRACCFVRFR